MSQLILVNLHSFVNFICSKKSGAELKPVEMIVSKTRFHYSKLTNETL